MRDPNTAFYVVSFSVALLMGAWSGWSVQSLASDCPLPKDTFELYSVKNRDSGDSNLSLQVPETLFTRELPLVGEQAEGAFALWHYDTDELFLVVE